MQLRSLPDFLSRAACGLTVLFPLTLATGHAVPDTALSLIATLFLIRSVAERNWQWLHERWIQCLLVLWLYMMARGLLAEHPQEALHRAAPLIRYILFTAALACWTLKDAPTRRNCFTALLCITFLLAADGLLQWTIGHDILRHAPDFDSKAFPRLTGPYFHPMLGIMLAWLYFPACLQLFITETGSLRRGGRLAAGIAGALFIFVVITRSGERMALLLTLFGYFIAMFLLPVKKRILFGVVALMMFTLGLIAFISPEVSSRQIHSTIDILQHWHQRPYGMLLDSDFTVAKENPVFGIGTNHFHGACLALYPDVADPDKCNSHPHNVYLEMLIENGVIGLALYLAFLFCVARVCVTHWASIRTSPLAQSLLIALCLRIWPFMSMTNFSSPWGAPPFWFVLGALLATLPSKPAPVCAS